MRNKTIILGLIAVFIASLAMMFLIGKIGGSVLSLIKTCEKESTALDELQQESTQKDMIIQVLLEKVKDKDRTVQILTKVVEEKANCETVSNTGLIR